MEESNFAKLTDFSKYPIAANSARYSGEWRAAWKKGRGKKRYDQ